MRGKPMVRLGAAVFVVLFTAVMPGARTTFTGHAQNLPPLPANVSVFATGLQAPRGLRFGPDGNLYVAEAGTGGTNSTVGLTQAASGSCEQVPGGPGGPGPGPFTGGYTARISQVSSAGVRTTVVDALPSTRAANGAALGVNDVEFVNGTLYALLSGGGCSHGNPDVPASVIRINPDGTWVVVADLSKFERANRVRTPDLDDYDRDGSWYSMVNVNGDLYADNANGSDIDKISPLSARITRFIDMSSEPYIGPTSIVYHNGNFYAGALGGFPIRPGTEKIYQITPDGGVSTFASGLTTVLGLAFDSQGQLYALESMTAPGFPGPPQLGTGKVVRVTSSGALETVASGLSFPTAMTFGPDGQLYVSNFGFGVPGAGQIVRVQIPPANTGATTEELTIPLTGPVEVPPGDPNGSGLAIITLKSAEGQICFQLSVSGIKLPATGAHIHRGAAGTAGPIVVPFVAPNASGSSSGCVNADRTLIQQIIANPSGYYVNVHNTQYPGGAVRGQL